jgi:hypothetical protein
MHQPRPSAVSHCELALALVVMVALPELAVVVRFAVC